jgi:DNA-binding MarR family transcriptional regulator
MDEKQRLRLKRFERALGQVRAAVAPTVPVAMVQTLIAVAMNEGNTLSDYANQTQANVSTISRHMHELGSRSRTGGEGHGLVDQTTDPDNLKKRRYTLTARGRVLVGQIIDTMEG